MHVPSRTTICIDVGGTYETRTIMRAELIVIHMTLNTFATHAWTCISTYPILSLQAIRHIYTNPDVVGPRHYHHHSLLLGDISDILEDTERKSVRTTLHKTWAHTNIRGNDIVDAAVKLAVTPIESLPEHKILKVVIGEIAPPMGNVHRKTTDTSFAFGYRPPTGRTSPALVDYTKGGPPQNAFVHSLIPPSQTKVRDPLLRDLHQTSL